MSRELDQGAERRRFTRRVAFFEEPDIVDRLEQAAYANGTSLATIIRAAIRAWIKDSNDRRVGVVPPEP